MLVTFTADTTAGCTETTAARSEGGLAGPAGPAGPPGPADASGGDTAAAAREAALCFQYSILFGLSWHQRTRHAIITF